MQFPIVLQGQDPPAHRLTGFIAIYYLSRKHPFDSYAPAIVGASGGSRTHKQLALDQLGMPIPFTLAYELLFQPLV